MAWDPQSDPQQQRQQYPTWNPSLYQAHHYGTWDAQQQHLWEQHMQQQQAQGYYIDPAMYSQQQQQQQQQYMEYLAWQQQNQDLLSGMGGMGEDHATFRVGEEVVLPPGPPSTVAPGSVATVTATGPVNGTATPVPVRAGSALSNVNGSAPSQRQQQSL
jgi:hypothetical protein